MHDGQGDAINSLTDSGKRPFNPTGVRLATLKSIAKSVNTIPEVSVGRALHPVEARMLFSVTLLCREKILSISLLRWAIQYDIALLGD